MKIISGGQTGVDQAALDAAIEAGRDYGGAIPLGRRTEQGPLSVKYASMTELTTAEYAARTEKNLCDADATLIVYRGNLSGGSKFTAEQCKKYKKELLLINLENRTTSVEKHIQTWLQVLAPGILNVAGPRESSSPGIYKEVKALLQNVFNSLK